MARVGSLYTSLTLESSSFVTGLRKAAESAERTGRTVEKALSRAQTAAVAFIGAISLGKIADAARGLTSIVDSARSVEAQLKLATKSSLDFASMQRSAARAARDFGQSYEQTVQMTAAIARATQNMGLSLQEQDALTRSLMANIRISGASADAVSNAMLQFRQAMEGGVFRAEEFNSINENTPQILRAVANGLGVTSGQLRQMMLDGKLSAETVAKALIAVREESERQAAQIPPRWDQAWTRMTDIARQAVARFDEGGEFSTTLLDWTNRVSAGFDNIGERAFRAGLEMRASIQTVRDVLADLKVDLGVFGNLWDDLSNHARGWADDWVRRSASSVDAITALWRAPQAAYAGLKAARGSNGWDGDAFWQAYGDSMWGSSMVGWVEGVKALREENKQRLLSQREEAELGKFIAEMAQTLPGGGSKPAAKVVDEAALKAAKKELEEVNRLVDSLLTERAARKENDLALSLLDKAVERGVITADEQALAIQRAREKMLDAMGLTALPPSIMKFDPQIEKSLPRFDENIDSVRAFRAEIERTAERARELDQAATQFAMHMTSSFEEALFAGQGLRSVFTGLLEDLGRMVLRLTVLEPLARSVADTLKGGFGASSKIVQGDDSWFGKVIRGVGGVFGGIFGGFRANGGPVDAGRAYLVGERGPELFMPGRSGTIIPNGALQGMSGGGRTINITVNAQDAVLASTVKGWIVESMHAATAAGSADAQDSIARRARRRIPGM